MKISDLIPLEKNPFKSKGDKQIELIAKSISKFQKMLSIRKIVIDEKNVIIGGNKRYFALKTLGYDDIPNDWIDIRKDLSEEEKREFIVKDNAHWGSEWDYDLLQEWDVDLQESGVIGYLGNDEKIDMVNDKENQEWVGMPEFNKINDSFKIIIHFENQDDRVKFLQEHPLKMSKMESKSWSTWYPYKERDDLSSLKYD